MFHDKSGFPPIFYYLQQSVTIDNAVLEMAKRIKKLIINDQDSEQVRHSRMVIGKYQRTLLHLACGAGINTAFMCKDKVDVHLENDELVSLLLDTGFNPSFCDSENIPAMFYALRSCVIRKEPTLTRMFQCCSLEAKYGKHQRTLLHFCFGSTLSFPVFGDQSTFKEVLYFDQELYNSQTILTLLANKHSVNVLDTPEKLTPLVHALYTDEFVTSKDLIPKIFDQLDRNIRFGKEFSRTIFHLACGSDVIHIKSSDKRNNINVFANFVVQNMIGSDFLAKDSKKHSFGLIPACFVLKYGPGVLKDDTILYLFSKTVENLKNKIFTFGKRKRTLLHIACGSGINVDFKHLNRDNCEIAVHPKMSSQLIRAFAKEFHNNIPDYCDVYKKSPLFYALLNLEFFEDTSAIELLPKPSNLSHLYGPCCRTLLHLALGAGWRADLSKHLNIYMEHIALHCINHMSEKTISQADTYGMPALFYALKNTKTSRRLLRKLLKKCDINVSILKGKIMHVICGCQNFDNILELCETSYMMFFDLIQNNPYVDVMSLDGCGKSPLQHAIEKIQEGGSIAYIKYIKIIKKLVKMDSFDPNHFIENQPTSSILFQSIYLNEREILLKLQQRSVQELNRNVKFDGHTVLHVFSGAKIGSLQVTLKNVDALH